MDIPAATGDVVRTEEWERIQKFLLDDARGPGLLVIEGEAGAGKSTLWRSGVELAAERGDRLLRSDPSEREFDLAFAGLSDLITEVLPSLGPLLAPPQLEALEITMLLRGSASLPPPPRVVGTAVLAILRELTTQQRTLLAIDDVQWFDEASLDALVFALRRFDAGPLRVLLAARSDAPGDPLTVGETPPSSGWRSLVATRSNADSIVLQPLTAPQVQRLLGDRVPSRRARLLAKQSRGNPFWAKELATSPDTKDASPPMVARTLQARLTRVLDPAASDALAVVSAAGRINVIDALGVLNFRDDAEAALDAAVLAGVVTENGGRVAAAHPLIGAAALAMLPPARRIARRHWWSAADSARHRCTGHSADSGRAPYAPPGRGWSFTRRQRRRVEPRRRHPAPGYDHEHQCPERSRGPEPTNLPGCYGIHDSSLMGSRGSRSH